MGRKGPRRRQREDDGMGRNLCGNSRAKVGSRCGGFGSGALICLGLSDLCGGGGLSRFLRAFELFLGTGFPLSGGYSRHQPTDSDHGDHALDGVCQHVQHHFGSDILAAAHQEMGGCHPGFDCPVGFLCRIMRVTSGGFRAWRETKKLWVCWGWPICRVPVPSL